MGETRGLVWTVPETGGIPNPPPLKIALDTDVVGCYGYYSDFSRTFHAGPDGPSSDQKLLYSVLFSVTFRLKIAYFCK